MHKNSHLFKEHIYEAALHKNVSLFYNLNNF